jgi:hypothetical protein
MTRKEGMSNLFKLRVIHTNLIHSAALSEKCFWVTREGEGWQVESYDFSHPDELIFQSSEFQFPPDCDRRALLVHEKL